MSTSIPLQHLLEGPLRALIAEEVARAVTAHLPEPSEPWVGVKQAAAHLDLSEDALRAMIKREQLFARRTPTGRIALRISELDAWVLSGGLDA